MSAHTLLTEDEMISICNSKLGEYKYVKYYSVKIKESSAKIPSTVKYAIVMYKNIKYRLVTSDQNNGMVVELYSHDVQIGTTYDYSNKKQYNSLNFYCKNSAVYYISIYFRNSSGHGICILGQK